MSVQLSEESDGLSVPCDSGVASTTWRTSDVSGGLLAFFDPCGSCFPGLRDRDDVHPDELDVDRVVRSTNNQAKALHLHPDDVPADHAIVDPDNTNEGEKSDSERCESCQKPVFLTHVEEPGHKVNIPCGCRVPVSVNRDGGVSE